MLQIYDLKTEYLSNPLGIDAANPRFSWKLRSDRIGVMQKTYRIVAESDGKVIWDSGVVESDASQRVRYAGMPLVSRQQVNWHVQVAVTDEGDAEETAQSETAWFEMGLIDTGDWKCKWIEPEDEVDKEARKPAPYLRRVFTVKPGLKSARIYQTAHGLYEFWINGKLGAEDKFKPGLTSYYYRIQYQTYDITDLIREGENCWSVMLGDGWWRGVTGGTVINNFGYKLHFFGQIELNYADGSREIIGTDEQFKTSTGGMIASDMLMGEIFDAGKEPDGWKEAGFDDSDWKHVHLATEHTDAALIPSRSVPVREKEVFMAKPFRDANGSLVLDFGQNIAGYVRMKLRGCQKGQKIRLVHGEDIDANGCFSVANIDKTPMPVDSFQEITYICSGAPIEEYCPLFAVFGFRYVLVEGYDGEIQDGDFVSIAVYSDMEETGTFKCSNPLINKLVQNSMWSQKGNFMDVATDCPTRERNAWTGDSQVYTRTATDFMNVYTFYEKWLQDQTIEQYASGKVGITFPSTSSVHNPDALLAAQKTNPSYALAGPTGNGNFGEDSAGWGDAAAWNPYMIYLCYGDEQILINQYETARKWVEFMLTCAKEHNPLYADEPQYHTYTDGELDADYIFDTRFHFGEWNEPIPVKGKPGESTASIQERILHSFKLGKPLVATAYMCRSTENVAHMAKILGKEEDYRKYSAIAEKIRRIYDKYLIGDDGVIEPGHQAAYVRVLAMNLCSEEKKEKVLQQLIKEIENNGYRLNTGFLSTPFILQVLVENGQTELAFRLLEQTESPSWLRNVMLGSTTILEEWNGMEEHQASYNHYSYGAVCDFLFGTVAGITPLFEAPGYKEFELKPTIGGTFTHAEAKYESLYGAIISGWEIVDGKLRYCCTVPVNTTAHLVLPNGDEHTLGSGEYEYLVSIKL